jgi:hypothetical protein
VRRTLHESRYVDPLSCCRGYSRVACDGSAEVVVRKQVVLSMLQLVTTMEILQLGFEAFALCSVQ